MKRSPFEVADPELVKKPTLRRPKSNTPILVVKKGTKELDAQKKAMEVRLAALKAEAAAAARQTDDIKRRTEEVRGGWGVQTRGAPSNSYTRRRRRRLPLQRTQTQNWEESLTETQGDWLDVI
jgi:hypothetical protein